MVKIDKVYTRGGDKGTTSLGAGSRVPKTDKIIIAIVLILRSSSKLASRTLAFSKNKAKFITIDGI